MKGIPCQLHKLFSKLWKDANIKHNVLERMSSIPSDFEIYHLIFPIFGFHMGYDRMRHVISSFGEDIRPIQNGGSFCPKWRQRGDTIECLPKEFSFSSIGSRDFFFN